MSPRIFLILSSLCAAPVWALPSIPSAQFAEEDKIPYLPPSSLDLAMEVVPEPPVREFSPRVSLPALSPRSASVQGAFLESPPNTFGQRPSEIYPHLTAIVMAFPHRAKMKIYGESASGASLVALEIAPEKPSKWNRRLAVICRQHGNEPEATASGIRLIHQFLKPKTAAQKAIAARTRLLIVPIANPDGAQVYERRTAQNVDMNRDWVSRRSPEVRALLPLVSGFKPQLLVDNHQWLPGHHQPPPMAETGGSSWAAMRAAKVMSSRSGARGLALKAKTSRRGATETLCHRFWGKRAKIPAILLETRHNPHKNGAREKAIVQATTALWGAAESLGH